MAKALKNKQLPQPVKDIGSVISRSIIAIIAIITVAAVFIIIMAGLTIGALTASCEPSDSKRQELITERTKSLDNITILNGQKIQSDHESSECDENAVAKLHTTLNTKQAMADIHSNLKAQGFKPDKKNGTLLFSNGEDQPLYFSEWFIKKKQLLVITYNFSSLRTCTELQQDCQSDTLNDNTLQLPLKDIEVTYGED